MDDASLAAFLNLSDEEAEILIPKLSAEKRAVFERMADVVADLNMGVIPDGVLVCRPKCGRH